MTETRRKSASAPLVDPADRTVSVRAFADSDVFAREQASVFMRSWVYVGHRSQFEKKGDFIQAYVGIMPVIVTLGNDGRLHVMANVCSHRGARVCNAEYGNAEKFVCPYHNWVYSNAGDLMSVPRASTPGFEKSRWGLFRAVRVETYRDLIFATFNPDVAPLEEYLGDMRWYLDLVVGSTRAGTEVVGTHRSAVHCNWKIPAEQFGSDNWHFQGVHGSMARLGRRNENPAHAESFHSWTSGGHLVICIVPKIETASAYSRYLDDLLAKGEISEQQRRVLRCSLVMTVFPNLSIVYFPGLCSIRVWHPRAANRTDLWSWALYNKDAPDAVKSGIRTQVTQMFSPTGMLEQDDLEVWSRVGSNLASMPPEYRLCYEFGLGEVPPERSFPGLTTSLQSDTPAFAFYQHWAELVGNGFETA